MDVEKEVKAAMALTIEHLKAELKGLRTNRANPALLDGVEVEVYGTRMRLKELANVTTPEARQLLITPFDGSVTNAIAKAIEMANLNVQPKVEKNAIRITLPSMDEALRKKMVVKCKEMGEKTKISLREVRRKYNEMVRDQKSKGDIPEDMMKKLEKKIQEFTDSFCRDVDQICQMKEKEIFEI